MKKIGILITLFIGQIFIHKTLGKCSFFIEKIYIHFYFIYHNCVTFLTKNIPFSMGDVLYLILAIVLLITTFRALIFIIKKRFQSLISLIQKTLIGLNIFILTFYIVWGYVYYLPELPLNTKNISTEELKIISEKYLQKCKELRTQCTETEDSIFVLNVSDKQFSSEINSCYQNIPKTLKRLPNPSRTSIKKSIFSNLLVYFGIGGYFNPFTQECQYVSIISEYRKPNTIAHELGHSLAYGKENEANFFAFLMGENSQNINIKYSTKLSALNHMLYALYEEDSLFVKEKRNQFSPEMKADRKADSLLQVTYKNPLENGFYGLNNAFLKFNEQEGVISYNQYIELVVGYERKK